jgi:hypothetical protein
MNITTSYTVAVDDPEKNDIRSDEQMKERKHFNTSPSVLPSAKHHDRAPLK